MDCDDSRKKIAAVCPTAIDNDNDTDIGIDEIGSDQGHVTHDVIGKVQRFNAESVVELARERTTSLSLSHHVSVTCALSFCKETVGEAA